MTVRAILIVQPVVDFSTFLGLCQEALGYNPSHAVAADPLNRSKAEQFVSCLAAMRDQYASVGFQSDLLSHVSFSFLVCAEEWDMLEILQRVNGAFVVANTKMRDVQLAVVTATLAQWREVVLNTSECVSDFCEQVKNAFREVRIDVWKPETRRLS